MKKNKIIHRIIVRTPNYLGDTIMTFAALELLKTEFPQAKFTMVCPDGFKNFFSRYNFVKKIVSAPQKPKRLKKIIRFIFSERKTKYDVGILFQNSFLNALIFRFLRINVRMGFNKEGQADLLNFSLKKHHGIHFRNIPYVNRYAWLVNSFLKNKYEFLPKIELKFEKYNFGFNNDFPVAVLNLGEKDKRQSIYPGSNSLELIEKLLRSNYNIVLIGEDNNKDFDKIFKKKSARCNDLRNKTLVNELVDVIASADGLISIDSAPIHIAAYVNTPFVALLGLSSSPFCMLKPVAGKGVYCRAEKPYIDIHASIKSIEAEEVIDHFKKILES